MQFRHDFIERNPVLRVKSGDILTLCGGLAVVLVIAFLVNPGYYSGVQAFIKPPVPTPFPTVTPALLNPDMTPIVLAVQTFSPTGTTAPEVTEHIPDAAPDRIYYTSDPFSYPRYRLPENMGIFGASETLYSAEEMVPFAFIEERRGGLTCQFTVPYPVWVLNISVTAERTPQYGNFRMVLAYAENGTIIDGGEILNRGTSYRMIQTSNTPLYMIISVANIDLYRINLETSRSYYDQYRPR